MRKKLIMRIGLPLLLKYGADEFTIHKLACEYQLNQEELSRCFPEGDSELLMDEVSYAGKLWIMKLKKELRNAEWSEEERLTYLVTEYVNGTNGYSDSLAVYIDLWKKIRDDKDLYLTKRLKAVYQMYANEFIEMLQEIFPWRGTEQEKKAFSLLMTVSSDTLHIQSMLCNEEFDIGQIVKILVKFAFLFIKERNYE